MEIRLDGASAGRALAEVIPGVRLGRGIERADAGLAGGGRRPLRPPTRWRGRATPPGNRAPRLSARGMVAGRAADFGASANSFGWRAARHGSVACASAPRGSPGAGVTRRPSLAALVRVARHGLTRSSGRAGRPPPPSVASSSRRPRGVRGRARAPFRGSGARWPRSPLRHRRSRARRCPGWP